MPRHSAAAATTAKNLLARFFVVADMFFLPFLSVRSDGPKLARSRARLAYRAISFTGTHTRTLSP